MLINHYKCTTLLDMCQRVSSFRRFICRSFILDTIMVRNLSNIILAPGSNSCTPRVGWFGMVARGPISQRGLYPKGLSNAWKLTINPAMTNFLFVFDFAPLSGLLRYDEADTSRHSRFECRPGGVQDTISGVSAKPVCRNLRSNGMFCRLCTGCGAQQYTLFKYIGCARRIAI